MFLRKERHGFTLLELIIVIIVIGILASVALPRYIRIVEKGRVAEAKSMLSAIRTSQMRYAMQYAAYTSDVSALDINLPAAKYFTITANNATFTNLSDESFVVGKAVRTTTDNPFGSSGTALYALNITMGGNISGDTIAGSVL